MDLEVFVTLGLGDSSFLVASGDEAVVVDPQRDAWRFVDAAARKGVRIRAVLETHVHNDYVSGALEIHEATGAEIVAPAKGEYAFAHRPAAEGDEVTIGDLVFRAWETPGHTYEHLSWAAHRHDPETPDAVFSGGSLLVGSAGRTDLLGPAHVDPLTRLQYGTVQRFRSLPGHVQVLPTHGAGSFCVSTLPNADRISTIDAERGHNGALLAADEAAFTRSQLTGLMEYPRYYPHMAPINRRGPAVMGALPTPTALTPGEFAGLLTAGMLVIDGRERTEFAEAHLPGSINIELNDGFGTYVGWMTPFDAPHVLVLPDPIDESLPEAMAQLVRIGYDGTVGYLAGGIDAWRAEGHDVRSYPLATTKELRERLEAGDPPAVLDVRQPGEWNSEGVVPGSILTFVGDLPDRLAALPRDRELWTLCTNGHRASIAASLLDREGLAVRLVGRSGILGLLDHVTPYSAADAPV
jgi:glyoxylase-like metal-dependent hydrolase (beta-lactamase superfamily II)/rhodanese-related sulfurtransferase